MNSDFYFRDYQKGDYKDVMNLWVQLNLGRKERGDNESVILQTIKLGGKFILLCSDNEIIGTCWLTTDGRRLFLHHFGIKENFQGQGLAHKLLDEAFKYANDLNLQVKLEVRRTNEKAIDLYKNSGFKYLGDYDVYILRDVENLKFYNDLE